MQIKLDLSQDMYEKQFAAWLHAVRTGDKLAVRSHFADAAKTYEATWQITQASGVTPPGI